MRLLFVEDDPIQRRLVERMAQRSGNHVSVVAVDAAEALTLDWREYDQVYVDVMMPNIDGVSLVRWAVKKFGSENLRVALYSVLDRIKLQKLADDLQADQINVEIIQKLDGAPWMI